MFLKKPFCKNLWFLIVSSDMSPYIKKGWDIKVAIASGFADLPSEFEFFVKSIG